MQNIIKLSGVVVDFENASASEFDKGINIKVYSDTHDLFTFNGSNEAMEDDHIFGIWVEFGDNDKERTIMANVSMDELELFARSILTHIKIFKSTYSEQIRKQISLGANI